MQQNVVPVDLVILASDGVWEFMSSADVVDLASQYQSLVLAAQISMIRTARVCHVTQSWQSDIQSGCNCEPPHL